MDFEFDVRKNAVNKRKHGIDFYQAQILWSDLNAVSFEVSTHRERRFVFIGIIENKYWSAVATLRNKKIRLISVRRSRKKEIDLYEKNKQKNQENHSN